MGYFLPFFCFCREICAGDHKPGLQLLHNVSFQWRHESSRAHYTLQNETTLMVLLRVIKSKGIQCVEVLAKAIGRYFASLGSAFSSLTKMSLSKLMRWSRDAVLNRKFQSFNWDKAWTISSSKNSCNYGKGR